MEWKKNDSGFYAVDESLNLEMGDESFHFNVISHERFGEEARLIVDTFDTYGNDKDIPLEYGGSLFYKGDVDSAKEIAEKTIAYFETNQNTLGAGRYDNLYEIKKQVDLISAEMERRKLYHQGELYPQGVHENRELETARKTGYVQGVCECVAAIGDDHTLGKRLLSKMSVTKDTAKKFASSETYKALEKGIFAETQEHNLEQTQTRRR
ncbi:MAG: hypothetical protein FWC64_12705 [Treponema sp.]|nr:hypothetical protein [Treponema sp.]